MSSVTSKPGPFLKSFFAVVGGVLIYVKGGLLWVLVPVSVFHLSKDFKEALLLIALVTLSFVNLYLRLPTVEKLMPQQNVLVMVRENLRHMGGEVVEAPEGSWSIVSQGASVYPQGALFIMGIREPLKNLMGIACRLEPLSLRSKGFKNYLFSQGYSHLCSVREVIFSSGSKLQSVTLGLKYEGVIKAIVLGQKWGIPKSLKETYAKGGLSHLLAISGFHMYVIFASVFLIFRYVAASLSQLKVKFLLNFNLRRVSLWISTLCCGFYLHSAGYPVSATRAFLIVFTYAVISETGITAHVFETLALVALVVLLWRPLELLSPSFLLSFSAFAGVVLAFKNAHLLWKLKPFLRYPLGIFVASASAVMFTSPVTAAFFHEVNAASLVTNVLVVPLFSLAVVFSITGISGEALFGVGRGLLNAADFLIGVSEKVAAWMSPVSEVMRFEISSPQGLCVIAGALIFFAVSRSYRVFVFSGLVLMCFFYNL